MNIINGNVTSPIVFSAGGANIGLKKDKKDMAVIVSENLCTASGCSAAGSVQAVHLSDCSGLSLPIYFF